MDDDLRVGTRREAMATVLEVIPELSVVVDLSVLDDDHGPVLVRDRLVSPLQVYDTQALDSEGYAGLEEGAARVRSPVLDRRTHALEESLVRAPARRQLSDDPAHRTRDATGALAMTRADRPKEPSTDRRLRPDREPRPRTVGHWLQAARATIHHAEATRLCRPAVGGTHRRPGQPRASRSGLRGRTRVRPPEPPAPTPRGIRSASPRVWTSRQRRMIARSAPAPAPVGSVPAGPGWEAALRPREPRRASPVASRCPARRRCGIACPASPRRAARIRAAACSAPVCRSR